MRPGRRRPPGLRRLVGHVIRGHRVAGEHTEDGPRADTGGVRDDPYFDDRSLGRFRRHGEPYISRPLIGVPSVMNKEALELSEEQLRVLDRLIDNKEISSRKEALDALFKLADIQLKANGL